MHTDPQTLAAHIRKVFGRLTDSPMWVAWEARPHQNPEKEPIKVPIDPNTGYAAKSNDPSTWAPMGKALSLASQRGLAGIGVMLGPDPDSNPDGAANKPWIVGVDYDNALRSDGALMPWAEQMFLADTYSEVSPSGTGVKALAITARKPEMPNGKDGVTLKLGAVEPAVLNGKRPAVEFYAGRRWFAITGQTYRGSDAKGIADATARIPVLLQRSDNTPAASPTSPLGDPDDTFTADDARTVYAEGLPPADLEHLRSVMQHREDFRQASIGTDWPDRSTALFVAADLAKGYRLTFAQFVHAVMSGGGAATSHVHDQPDPYRALARAWDRSPQPMPIENPGPVPAGEIGDRPGVDPVQGYVLPAPDGGVMPDLSWMDEVNPLGTPSVLPADLYANPPPRPKFILTDLIPAAPTVMVGTGGVMKSTIWMQMALNMLLGWETWGRTWAVGGSVLMVSKEDERDIILRRLADMLHGMNVTERQYRDVIANRFYLDDLTASPTRLVESDGRGNLIVPPTAEHMADKYADRSIMLACLDPMVNFGPGEVHGNDGAAMMQQVAWRLTHAWGGGDRCNVTYIHHISQTAARDEIDDAHTGRGGTATGDNARSVWVMHRHKIDNPNRHVAPPSIAQETIERGDVIRLRMAKNSYARRIDEPFWAVRENGMMRFIAPLPPEEARVAAASVPTPRERQEGERKMVQAQQLAEWVQGKGTAVTVRTIRSATDLPPGVTRGEAGLRTLLNMAVEMGLIEHRNGRFSAVASEPEPTEPAAYGF